MANIRIKDLPLDGTPNSGDRVPIDLGTTRQATVETFVMAGRPTASKTEAEAGIDPKKAMTPLTVRQAIDAQTGMRYVPVTRRVDSGTGLSGGQELTGDVTLSLNAASIASLAKADSAVQPSRTLTAGTGLSGLGNLSADRTVSLNQSSIDSLSRADSAIQAPGGTTGQILFKESNLENHVSWRSIAAATAVSYTPQVLSDAEKTQARANIDAEKVYNSVSDVQSSVINTSVMAIRTNGYSSAGDGGAALYKRAASEPSHAGKIQSADGAWWELVTDVANVRMFGAKGDGVSDDTSSLQGAWGYAKDKIVPNYYPSGTYMTSVSMPIWSGCVHYGDNGQYGSVYLSSVIKLKAGSNVDVALGETTSAQWDTIWADWYDIGDNFWTIKDLVLDGNRSENLTSGHGLRVWGRRYTLSGVTIRNTRGSGLVTKYSDGSVPSGMESYFSNVVIDSVGGHGWEFMGPHDSIVNCMNVIDAGINEHNVYSGLDITLGGNARFFAFHAWSRGGTTNRMRYALNMGYTAGLCDFSGSHFEGAYQANVVVSGGTLVCDDTCAYYAAWNGVNVLLTTGGHTIRGRLGSPGAGRPASKGIVLGFDPSQNVWGCRIDIFCEGQAAGVIDFNRSTGGNMINAVGYNDTGVLSIGSPHAGDTCMIKISGGGGGRIFQDAT